MASLFYFFIYGVVQTIVSVRNHWIWEMASLFIFFIYGVVQTIVSVRNYWIWEMASLSVQTIGFV